MKAHSVLFCRLILVLMVLMRLMKT